MNLPVEFDINIYRNSNTHLRNFNDKEIMEHFNYYGYYEGLKCNSINSRVDFIKLINQNLNILEIGPLCNPCMDVSRPNVETIDYFTQEELKENYKTDPNVNINKICKVNYVVKGSTKYNELILNKKNVCFSSHNIEHVPCVISFLNNVSSILFPKGLFFLCIPDYRFCFDRFRNPTNIFEILDPYYNNKNNSSSVSILESRFLTTHNDSVKHWDEFYKSIQNIFVPINNENNFMETNKIKIINSINEIENIYKTNKYTHIDCHSWKFTPKNFKIIIEILNQTKLIDFSIQRIYRTLKNSNEFYVILQKN